MVALLEDDSYYLQYIILLIKLAAIENETS